MAKNCWLLRKQMFFFEQQEKRWSTLKQALIVSGQGSAIIQMTICTFSTLQATGPGPRVYKM